MKQETRRQIYERLRASNPNPQPELNYSTAFELLIAVILSAQATDISVNKVTKDLFPIANTPEAFIKLGLEELEKKIKSIGLFRSKAKNIIKTCEILINEHDSRVPDNRKDLEKLFGVGRKTANVVLNIYFKQPTIAVDTHIFRVSNRTGIAPGKNELAVEKELLRITPDEFLLDAHHWLLLHGRYVCTARSPKCSDCIINDLCEKHI